MAEAKLGLREFQRIFGPDIVRDLGDGYYAVILSTTSDKPRMYGDFALDFAERLQIDTSNVRVDDVPEKKDQLLFRAKTTAIEKPEIVSALKAIEPGEYDRWTGYPYAEILAREKALRDPDSNDNRQILLRLKEATGVEWEIKDVYAVPHYQTAADVPNALQATFELAEALDINMQLAGVTRGRGKVSIPLTEITLNNIGKIRERDFSNVFKGPEIGYGR